MSDSEQLAELLAYRRVCIYAQEAPLLAAREAQPKQEPVAHCPRVELVVTLHTLASHFENALYAFREDAEALRKAKGDIASIAVYSILRDWIKGQVTAIETGILTFEGAFLGQILLGSGRTVLEHAVKSNMLPQLEAPK